ncbi:MAG: anti-sigma factor [Actinomycetia bacterium]|nr:anti-sigma factor [Actinomycetes bacterium]
MSSELDLHHLAAAYALDAVDADERIAFEAHYHDCEVCSHDVRDFRATVAALGELSVTAPPPDLKARVLQQVAVTRQLSPHVAARDSASPRRVSWLAAAAAVLLIVATTSYVVGRGSQDDDAFASQLEQVLAEPDVRMVDLEATSATTSGRIHVAWSASLQQAAVIGDGLVSPNDGLVYELWLINDTGAQATRMLDSAEGGDVRRILSLSGTPTKWGITIEPAAGSAVVTGEILFLGNV